MNLAFLLRLLFIFRDATHKMPDDERHGRAVRDWPPLMEISEEMKRKVQERWREYGFV